VEALSNAIDFVLHLDASLLGLVRDYGAWAYGVLFLVVFCETGLVVTPFLPGDSLLFAAGAIAAAGSLDVSIVIVALTSAAILGAAVNYSIGRTVAARWIVESRFVRRDHLRRAEKLYRRRGESHRPRPLRPVPADVRTLRRRRGGNELPPRPPPERSLGKASLVRIVL
jgi:membrane-associated protein